jgi:phenylalanyl-tRNA synthetase alpha chain
MTIEHILNSIKNPVNINEETLINTEELLKNSENLENLQQNKNKIFDAIKEQLSLMKNYSLEEKKIISKNLNELKQLVFDMYANKKKFFDEMLVAVDKSHIYLPVNYTQGSLHPITITINKIYKIMKSIGFSFIEAPEIDDPENIFEKLNMDEFHPARADQQSFSLKNEKLMPRTQCTNFQSIIFHSWNNQDPVKYFHCGHVYRYDSDATHTPKFSQFEVMYINKDANIPTLLGFVDIFFEKFFGYKVESRIRTSYFPFTEISYEVDIFLNGRWLEIGGCGLIHKKVFENNNKEYKNGWAWGMGIERLTAVANNYKDIRKFYNI